MVELNIQDMNTIKSALIDALLFNESVIDSDKSDEYDILEAIVALKSYKALLQKLRGTYGLQDNPVHSYKMGASTTSSGVNNSSRVLVQSKGSKPKRASSKLRNRSVNKSNGRTSLQTKGRGNNGSKKKP